MKRLMNVLLCFGFAATARAGNTVQENANFHLPGMVSADIAGSASALKLPQPGAVSGAAAEKGEKLPSASLVPAWFSTSRLSFVMLRQEAKGGFTAILRSGVFTTAEMGVFVEASGNTTVDFTEYASNPMAPPKNKAEVTANTEAARKEVAAILREVQRNKPVQGDMLKVLKNLLSYLETPFAARKEAAAARGTAVPGCPAIEEIKAEWVEHTNPADIPLHVKERLNSAMVQSGPLLLPIHRIPYYLGVVRRGDLVAQADLEPGCRITGTAAYYVIGEEGAPEINFDLIMTDPGQEKTLAGRLAELRWFDLKDGQRHRWYSLELAAGRGWLTDEYGRPTPDYRPIETFTGGINELY